jgi:inorganic pyrophosphatase
MRQRRAACAHHLHAFTHNPVVSLEILCIVEIPSPTAYGFVPETLGPDGTDPLGVMVAVSQPTLPGGGVIARPVAVLEISDQGEREPKVLCVACGDPRWRHIAGLDDLPDQLVDEVAAFVVAHLRRQGREIDVIGWSSHEDAKRVIREAQERFRENHPGATPLP